MAIGVNLLVTGPASAVMRRILRAFGVKANGKGGEKLRKKVFLKDGAPVDDTAADSPAHAGISAREVGSLCYDYTNNDVYVCDAYTNDTTYSWQKVAT